LSGGFCGGETKSNLFVFLYKIGFLRKLTKNQRKKKRGREREEKKKEKEKRYELEFLR